MQMAVLPHRFFGGQWLPPDLSVMPHGRAEARGAHRETETPGCRHCAWGDLVPSPPLSVKRGESTWDAPTA